MPGRDFVGVEVPNVTISQVSLRGVMSREEFKRPKARSWAGLGRDVSGQPMATDLAPCPTC